MPAVLDGEADVRRWLDFGEVKSLDALKLLQPTNLLTFHPVSSLVNNSRNNSPECLQPVDLQAKKVRNVLLPGSRACSTMTPPPRSSRTHLPSAGAHSQQQDDEELAEQ